jgi:YHS domain-containing protein
MKPMKKDVIQLKDPVCGMVVDPASAKAQTRYKGQKIYFCSRECLKEFLYTPERYGLTKKKGFWARYLERLGKAIAANPPSCHG